MKFANMKYAIDKQDRFAVLEIQEEKLDSRNAPDLKGEFVLLGNEGYRNIVLNLKHLQFADSSGLSALLVGNRICQQNNGQMVLCCPGPNIQKMIDISQLNTVFTILPTQQEAMEAVMLSDLELELEDEMRVVDRNGDDTDADMLEEEEEEGVWRLSDEEWDTNGEDFDDDDADDDEEDWDDDDEDFDDDTDDWEDIDDFDDDDDDDTADDDDDWEEGGEEEDF